jgi:hypothetical protein
MILSDGCRWRSTGLQIRVRGHGAGATQDEYKRYTWDQRFLSTMNGNADGFHSTAPRTSSKEVDKPGVNRVTHSYSPHPRLKGRSSYDS